MLLSFILFVGVGKYSMFKNEKYNKESIQTLVKIKNHLDLVLIQSFQLTEKEKTLFEKSVDSVRELISIMDNS